MTSTSAVLPTTLMFLFQLSRNAEALKNTIAAFNAYAASTLLVLDLVGTFVFALSGSVAAVKRRLDLFGVLVLLSYGCSLMCASRGTKFH